MPRTLRKFIVYVAADDAAGTRIIASTMPCMFLYMSILLYWACALFASLCFQTILSMFVFVLCEYGGACAREDSFTIANI